MNNPVDRRKVITTSVIENLKERGLSGKGGVCVGGRRGKGYFLFKEVREGLY